MKDLQHVFPFLWLKGEDKNLIEEELDAIQECGVNAVCLESRIHPEFGKDKWFEDVEYILQRAKERGMQVWILDDFSYPTGYARGMFMKERSDLKGWQIATRFVDVAGEVKNAKIPFRLDEKNNETLLGVFMAKRGYDSVVSDSAKEITDRVKNGVLYTDIPYGSYRIFFLVKSQGFAERDNYIDMLNPQSTDYFLDVIYEEHYRRLAPYFGNPLVGFFSDEPRLCNGFTGEPHVYKPVTYIEIGDEGVALPYSDALVARLKVTNVAEWLKLWVKNEGYEKFRCDYMTEVTKLYHENFNGKLSAWCHAHGVAYAGHIIEDNGAHLRTRCSAGHYFRSQEGATMSGIDIVLHQIKPYDTETRHFAPSAGGYADGTFFLYLLAKLASSSANLDSVKKGRALCETFGAYGWGESTKEMSFLVNHLLSRGINYFIPHAFSMQENDKDCPPHFYMRGKNPAFKGYGVLFRYMDEMGTLFSDGTSFADVALLYHDEAEWSGRGYEPCEKIAKILTENQIEFDVVYSDYLRQMQEGSDGIELNGRTYKFIVVPDSEYLTPDTLALLQKFGDRVLYCGRIPAPTLGKKVPKGKLAETLYAGGVFRLTEEREKGLRAYRYEKEGKKYLFLFNEYGKSITFSLANGEDVYAEDKLSHERFFYAKGKEIRLAAGQAILCTEKKSSATTFASRKVKKADVWLKKRDEENFSFYKKVTLPFDINGADELPDFCGEIKYAFDIDFNETDGLQFEFDGEFCLVETAGVCKTCVGGRAYFDATAIQDKHTVWVTLANTLAYAYQDDRYSTYSYIPAACLYSAKY